MLIFLIIIMETLLPLVGSTFLCMNNCAVPSTQTLPEKCEALNAESSRVAFYHKHRCYVIHDGPSSMNWMEASSSCTDVPNGGLALWIDKRVFQWINTTTMRQKWVWAGMFDAESNLGGSGSQTMKTAQYFTQSGTTNVSLGFVIVKSELFNYLYHAAILLAMKPTESQCIQVMIQDTKLNRISQSTSIKRLDGLMSRPGLSITERSANMVNKSGKFIICVWVFYRKPSTSLQESEITSFDG